MAKNYFNFEKCSFFWQRLSTAPYINVMIICKMLIYCVKLDHALYSMNYGSHLVGKPQCALGQPHNTGDNMEQSVWAALVAAAVQLGYRHDTRPFLSCEGAGLPD